MRLLAAIAVQEDLDLYHFDAEQAFGQSNLDEELYMKLPQGYGRASGMTAKLARSLYGLKQASSKLYELLASKLIDFGLEQCKADPCVFRLSNTEHKTAVAVVVHVDNTIVAVKVNGADVLFKHRNSFFPKKNLVEITHYMGFSFKWD